MTDELDAFYIRDPTFPIIKNRNNFVIGKHTYYNPRSQAFINYWRLHKKRCIEGFWSIDDPEYHIDVNNPVEPIECGKKWRFMPPNLYFYVNFGVIKHKPEGSQKTDPKKIVRPYLRDFEWAYFYNFIEARGFSGFSDDDEYTCLEAVDKFEKNEILEDDADLQVESIYKKDGSLKKYIPARQYLRQLFDKPMGLPLYENQSKNIMLLGARGGGKSYLTGVGVVLHEWLFDGARIYNKESIENPSVVEILVGAANTAKSKDILDKTELALNNLAGPGGYTKHPFYKEHMGTLKSNNINNAFRNEYLKKIGGEWVKKGSMSNIKHVTFTVTNPEAAAGTRPNVIVVEEVGLLENVLQVHASNEATMVTDGTNRFGSTIYIGTGGNMDKIVESEILFRDPVANTLLAFEDIYENSGMIGWFVPAYYMDGTYKDENGNTKIKEAIDHYMKRREVKRKAKSMKAIDGELTNYPLKPSEMFSSNNSNIFPINDLKERLIEIQIQSYKEVDRTLVCELGIDSNGNVFTYPVDSNKVIRNFPALKSMDLDGAVEIYEEPKKDSEDNVFMNRYYAGTDTYDDDKVVDTISLGSIFIMDSWTRRIVAEYTGRRLTKDFYEITRRLTMYYNAVNNYEQNKKGLFSYYEKVKSLYLLAETPKSLKDEAGTSIIRTGNRKYGTTTTTAVINYGINLILNWLLEEAYGEDSNISNVFKIKSKGLLEELIKYNPKHGNYDRIFSLIMLLILVEDRHRIIDEQINNMESPKQSIEQDEFFSRNYDQKYKSMGIRF